MKWTALLLICFALLLSHGGLALMQADVTVRVFPDKAYYYPGESATFSVVATGGGRVEATITHLAETVDTFSIGLVQGAATLSWMPPAVAPRGYGLTVHVLDENGTVLATTSTAFDVLENWKQAPRYGFLSQFEPGRDNEEMTMDWAARYHVNGLQFYDWQYRHENLLPPDETYSDLLGRRMSLETVMHLIEAAHAHHIAAMPYTAIYGASVAFYREHPQWALFQRPDHPYEFGDNFLIIMDPSPDSPWSEHLLGEFGRVLDELDFDGIHLDQYGAPKVGYNAAGERVDLAQAIPAFIDRTAQVVHERRGNQGAVIFNAVGNWPVETVAPADQDAVYIEVWEPYRSFWDLHRLIAGAENLGDGKPVIIAAYIHPDRIYNVRLANAIIFASGGYHLELGEPGAMLADPYFPRFGLMNETVQSVVRRYYDFLVRYEEVLALDTTNATGDRAEALSIAGIETQKLRSKDKVAVIVRQGPHFETFSLVNLMGIDSSQWDSALSKGPDPLISLPVRIHTDRQVARIWLASPDGDNLDAQFVELTTGTDEAGAYIAFALPRLDYWTMIVLEYEL
jgi:dextranase